MAGILIVDDQPHVRKLVSSELSGEGYRIRAIEDAALTWEHINALQPDLVLVNSLSERFDSFELLIDIKHNYPKFPVLVYVIKSYDAMDRLKQTITGVLDESRLPNPTKKSDPLGALLVKNNGYNINATV